MGGLDNGTEHRPDGDHLMGGSHGGDRWEDQS